MTFGKLRLDIRLPKRFLSDFRKISANFPLVTFVKNGISLQRSKWRGPHSGDEVLLPPHVNFHVNRTPEERASTTPPSQVNSFQQVLNDFRASYFGSVLLMPRSQMLEDIQTFFNQDEWSSDSLQVMLDKYQVSPENLMYRFSELIPQFFGLPVHYLAYS